MGTFGDFVVLGGLFILVAALLFLGITLGTTYLTQQLLQKQWGKIAQRAGLQIQKGGILTNPSLIGSYQGRPIKLYTYRWSSGRGNATYTAITLSLHNRSGGLLTLRPEEWLENVEKALGMEEVEIGDAAFDQRYIISSNPPDFAAHVLRENAPLRSLLVEVPDLRIHLQGNGLFCQQRSLETDSERIMTLFDVLSQIADAVERASRFEVREEVGILVDGKLVEEVAQPDYDPLTDLYDPFDPRVKWQILLFVLFLVSGLIVIIGLEVWKFLSPQ